VLASAVLFVKSFSHVSSLNPCCKGVAIGVTIKFDSGIQLFDVFAMTIFISHSHKDDDFVDRLRSDLHKLGHHTWVDHHDIPAGKVWDEVVEVELVTSDAMILIV
jgi:hypothetical protein